MLRETALENAHISVWFYPETGIVHHQIHRYASGVLLQGFRGLMKRLATLSRQ